MRSILAGLRTLVIPWGTSGATPRIVIGNSIPSVLTSWTADFTFKACTLWYFNSTDFYFEAIAIYHPDADAGVRVAGFYDSVNGPFLIQRDDDQGRATIYGSNTYNFQRLDVEWLRSDLVVGTGSTLEIDGTQTVVGTLAIADAGVISGNAIPAPMYSQLGTGVNSIASAVPAVINAAYTTNFTKIHTATSLRVDVTIGAYCTAVATAAQFTVRAIGGATFTRDVAFKFFNVANQHLDSSGTCRVAGGGAPGVYAVTLMWARTTGAGTVTSDLNDWVSIAVTEVY